MDGFTGKRIKATTPEERANKPMFWYTDDGYYTFDDPVEFGHEVKLDMPRTKRLAEYINGNIRGGEIKFQHANRVSDGIKVQYQIVPDNSEAFEASQTVAMDFDLRELASIVRQKAEQQIVEAGQ